MCGIAGVFKRRDLACAAQVLDRMRDEVSHRGPNDKGSAFFSRSEGTLVPCPPSGSGWEVGIGNRRLSILDLSPAGHQPMQYAGRYWITYNGEVYNYVELREELKALGHTFKSDSDTEVILAAHAQWGTDCFARFHGMWGLIIVDLLRDDAIICRNALGIKPVYLWRTAGMLAIASEIKQFSALPGFRAIVNRDTAAEYLATGYENHSETFFEGVHPLPAATWIRVSLRTLDETEPQKYWYPQRIPVAVYDGDQAAALLMYKFERSLRHHLRSDVPVGCALSGGLDSASIALVVDTLQGRSVALDTFTAEFPTFQQDESEYANIVNEAIHSQPHSIFPRPETFLEDLDHFTWAHDEPVSTLSVYAGYCVARSMKTAGVPVTLNGQGGDEVLGGYWQSYLLHLKDLAVTGHLLALSAELAGAAMKGGNPSLLSQIPVMFGQYRARRRPMLAFDSSAVRTNLLLRAWTIEARERRLHEIDTFFLPRFLRWEDRNSMAFSIEGRYPFLDRSEERRV